MGTIYKQKKDYLESSKCFQNAYRFEPDNIQLLKDIAAMQIQIRDHSAHIQTRLSILKLKPNLIHNWTGFVVANHLVFFILIIFRKAIMKKCLKLLSLWIL